MKTLDELHTLGEAELGRPLRVELWDMPAPTLGVAWTDLRGTATIALSAALLDDPALLRKTFWHEVAHHRAGDCPTPEPDPPLHRLAAPAPYGYTETPRERLAEARATLYAELQSMGMLETPRAKPPARKERTVAATWTQLIDKDELDGLSRTLRSKLDTLPLGTAGREGARRDEVDGVEALKQALHDYRTAHRSRTPLKAVMDAQRRAEGAARKLNRVCAYAGVPVPQRLCDLADGRGMPAPVPTPAAPKRPSRSNQPRQQEAPVEWGYAALDRRQRRW